MYRGWGISAVGRTWVKPIVFSRSSVLSASQTERNLASTVTLHTLVERPMHLPLCFHEVRTCINHGLQKRWIWHDGLAERSKALASGASPKGRGFESHSRQRMTGV